MSENEGLKVRSLVASLCALLLDSLPWYRHFSNALRENFWWKEGPDYKTCFESSSCLENFARSGRLSLPLLCRCRTLEAFVGIFPPHLSGREIVIRTRPPVASLPTPDFARKFVLWDS